MRKKAILQAVMAAAALAAFCRPAAADDRQRGDKFQLGASADNAPLNVFAGKTDGDFNFVNGTPQASASTAVAPAGASVTIEEILKTADGDGWYLVDVDGPVHAHGFVRAQELNALPVAKTLPAATGLNWWDKVSPRELAAQKKAALAEETRIATKAYDEQQTRKFAAAHGGPRSAQLVIGNVCVLGMGKKLTPLHDGPSATAPLQLFLRDGTLAVLRPDTDPLWRLVDAYMSDGSTAEGYVAKWALGNCFMRMGTLYTTDVPNLLLPQ